MQLAYQQQYRNQLIEDISGQRTFQKFRKTGLFSFKFFLSSLSHNDENQP